MRYLKYIINTFIVIILTILITTLMFINCSKTLISSENISDFINDANILDMDINTLFNKEESGIILKDKLYTLAIENNIPKEIIEDILKSDEINYLLGDFFNQSIKYIINNTEKPKILPETIEDMKNIANQSLEEHLNIMLEPEILDTYIEDYCNSITTIIPERDNIIGDIPLELSQEIVNFNISYIYIIIILILILTILINKKWYIFIKYLGISMLISGIIFVILGSLEYIIINLITNKITAMQSFILPLITNILTIFFKSGVLVSFTSIVVILIYMTLNKTK